MSVLAPGPTDTLLRITFLYPYQVKMVPTSGQDICACHFLHPKVVKMDVGPGEHICVCPFLHPTLLNKVLWVTFCP